MTRLPTGPMRHIFLGLLALMLAVFQSALAATGTNQQRLRVLAWPGYAHDARRFVAQALQAGASACLVDDHHLAAFGFDDERW